MHKGQIKPGVQYAIREAPGASLQRVKVLEHIRADRWRAEWIAPNPGLIHFVKSAQIVATWRGHRALLQEEGARAALRAHNAETGHREGSPLDNAISCVYEAAGGEVTYYRGALSGTPEALDRLKTRAKMPAGRVSTYSYVDRSGTQYLPFDEALELAQKFAAAEPATVLADVEATERKWAHDSRVPGEEHLIGLLNEYRAAWAIIHQWTGLEPAIAEREQSIQKLERLVWDAIYALQKAGLDTEARRLRRAIGRE